MENLGDVGCRPCFATKAATAAKRLQAAGARCEAKHARTILNTESIEGGGCAVNTAALAPAIAVAQVAGPPMAPGVGICPAGTSIKVGHPTGTEATVHSNTGRARLPGLRTLNGLGTSGSASAHRPGAALPLLLACTRGGRLGSQDSAVVAGPGYHQAVCRTSALISDAATCRASVPQTRSSQLALTAGAFLPPPAAVRMPSSGTSRQQVANLGMPTGTHDSNCNLGCHSRCKDGAREVANTGKSLVDSGPAAGVKALVCASRDHDFNTRNAIPKLGSSYTTSTTTRSLGQVRRQGNGVEGDPRNYCNGSDDAGAGSSYESCCSYSGYSTARSHESESETEDSNTCKLKSPKRRRMEGNFEGTSIAGGATAAASMTTSAGAAGSMDAAAPSMVACSGAMASGSPGVANTTAFESAGTTAAAALSNGLHSRCTTCSYGPPWALIPLSGRKGTLRCSLHAARVLWPTLLDALRTSPQLVVLDVEVPSDGVRAGNCEHGGSGVATVAVRALLRCDEKTMVLRPVEELPLGPRASAPVLLQISPHPNGEGAVIQLANRHVWAYYRSRGGKLCCPSRLGVGTAMVQASGCLAAADGYDDGYVLQIRLGANLFDNRSFDVGIRAAERLFGHLVPGLQELVPARTSAAGPVGGGLTDERGAAVLGRLEGNADAADSSGGGSSSSRSSKGGSAGNGIMRATRAVATKVNGNASDPLSAARSGSYERADGGGDAGNRSGNGIDRGPGIGGGGGRRASAAGRRELSVPLPIHSLVITVIAEAWPEARSKVEFRYRFPRLLGMPTNAHHAYATLASNLVAPMVLYGAQPGDMFEMWRHPGGAPEEFLCRVVRSAVKGGKKRHAPKGSG